MTPPMGIGGGMLLYVKGGVCAVENSSSELEDFNQCCSVV